jgi:hypothetical protein
MATSDHTQISTILTDVIAHSASGRGRCAVAVRTACVGSTAPECGKTFNALTGTPLANLHYKGRWFDFARSLSEGESVRKSAARCDVAVSTAFRWRHRFLRAIRTDAVPLGGIVEADETYVLESRKGSRAWKDAAAGQPDAEAPERKPRKRGGKATRRGLSGEQVPVLVAADRTGATISAVLPAVNADTIKDVLAPVLGKDALLVTDGASFYPACAAKLDVTHETLNQSAGERIRGELHIQTVNSRHERLKTFLRRYRGIASKYLGSYLKWFHLAGIYLDPSHVPERRHGTGLRQETHRFYEQSHGIKRSFHNAATGATGVAGGDGPAPAARTEADGQPNQSGVQAFPAPSPVRRGAGKATAREVEYPASTSPSEERKGAEGRGNPVGARASALT